MLCYSLHKGFRTGREKQERKEKKVRDMPYLLIDLLISLSTGIECMGKFKRTICFIFTIVTKDLD